MGAYARHDVVDGRKWFAGTLIGIRGELEGFSTIELSVVMSAYFVGLEPAVLFQN